MNYSIRDRSLTRRLFKPDTSETLEVNNLIFHPNKQIEKERKKREASKTQAAY